MCRGAAAAVVDGVVLGIFNWFDYPIMESESFLLWRGWTFFSFFFFKVQSQDCKMSEGGGPISVCQSTRRLRRKYQSGRRLAAS